MNYGRECENNKRKRSGSRLILRALEASSKLASLVLCLLILGLSVEVGFGQEPPSARQQTEQPSPRFRIERTAVSGGGELITIWARVVDDSDATTPNDVTQVLTKEIPLISVLRDTLGDSNHANDVLREVWVHTYAKPKLVQQAAAFVPFLYKGLHVKAPASLKNPPRAIINLSDTEQSVWRRLFVSSVVHIGIDQPLLRASVHSYQRNIEDYRKSNMMRALTVLSLYESEANQDAIFSEAELTEIQAKLALRDKTFGGLVDPTQFSRFHEQEKSALRDERGHNWELLRQQAEASGLYFESLQLGDKTITHALVWLPVGELSNPGASDRPFHGRFLNIKNPWSDARLRQWKGYSEKKYFENENQLVTADDATGPPNRAVTMVPLALYGLDFDKIPALLIDFRNPGNPRKRELSGRLIKDITRDVLSISRFGNIYYFLGSSAFNFVTKQRGIDVNQPSRLNSVAELRLLVSFNDGLSNGLRKELSKGIDNLSVNPLENGSNMERELAYAQHQALQTYARRPDGLPARLEQQRAAEMAKFAHQGFDGKLLRLANVLTLGRYTHREKLTPDLRQQLDKNRQLAYHVRFLRQVAKSTAVVEVAWKMEEVLPSLRYIAENGTEKDKEAARTVGSIFSRTEDDVARELCLEAMKRIGNKTAQREMRRIYDDVTVAIQWRLECARYLQLSSPTEAKVAQKDESVAGAGIEVSQRPGP